MSPKTWNDVLDKHADVDAYKNPEELSAPRVTEERVEGCMWPAGHGMPTTPLNGYETLKTALDRNRSVQNETGCGHLATRSEIW
jgi:hypothetical protein